MATVLKVKSKGQLGEGLDMMFSNNYAMPFTIVTFRYTEGKIIF